MRAWLGQRDERVELLAAHRDVRWGWPSIRTRTLRGLLAARGHHQEDALAADASRGSRVLGRRSRARRRGPLAVEREVALGQVGRRRVVERVPGLRRRGQEALGAVGAEVGLGRRELDGSWPRASRRRAQVGPARPPRAACGCCARSCRTRPRRSACSGRGPLRVDQVLGRPVLVAARLPGRVAVVLGDGVRRPSRLDRVGTLPASRSNENSGVCTPTITSPLSRVLLVPRAQVRAACARS